MPKVTTKFRPGAKTKRGEDADTQLLDEAKDAVCKFEDLNTALRQMQEQFEEEFPEANESLQQIKSQEDEVNSAIEDAKIKVALAKTSVGDFECTRAFRQAGYDDKKLSGVLFGLEDRGDVFDRLVSANVIVGVKVDRDNAAAFAASNPKSAAPLSSAWEDRTELTPRVKTPKM
jgi:hypothetical protein